MSSKTVWRPEGVSRILRNEKNCGNVLLQKHTRPDFMSTKVMLNKGHQTQYFIEGHHTGIVSVEDWEAAKSKLQQRHGVKERGETIILCKKEEKTVFFRMFYCGSCGNYLTRKMATSIKKEQKYRFPAWICRANDGRMPGVECHVKRYREEAMEHAFMAMLLKMKQEPDELIEETKSAIEKVAMDGSEIDKMGFLQQEIESLYRRISQIGVDVKENQILDEFSEMILPVAQKIEFLVSEWEKLDNKLQNELLIKRNFKWLIEEVNALEEFDPTIESIEFRKDIFSRIVKRGVVFNDGSITYELNIGVMGVANYALRRQYNYCQCH